MAALLDSTALAICSWQAKPRSNLQAPCGVTPANSHWEQIPLGRVGPWHTAIKLRAGKYRGGGASTDLTVWVGLHWALPLPTAMQSLKPRRAFLICTFYARNAPTL